MHTASVALYSEPVLILYYPAYLKGSKCRDIIENTQLSTSVHGHTYPHLEFPIAPRTGRPSKNSLVRVNRATRGATVIGITLEFVQVDCRNKPFREAQRLSPKRGANGALPGHAHTSWILSRIIVPLGAPCDDGHSTDSSPIQSQRSPYLTPVSVRHPTPCDKKRRGRKRVTHTQLVASLHIRDVNLQSWLISCPRDHADEVTFMASKQRLEHHQALPPSQYDFAEPVFFKLEEVNLTLAPFARPSKDFESMNPLEGRI
ncbi:hypothetical protein BXZ70DRAFT_955170 [Cristinia sonorae]|uniref:Uncharacterized protein n=1 Tax=Cristinia sonorae TaxID=1940300 RepID=A0A8K0XL93_9AGAR|nr:hypothetical protein BXZ70DRAFT_955170 [Cristinia sonorae]